ncbi:MAG: YHS domain-containing protein [Dehalococcoidia bacterium]|nr:YHS domain-containing protein [Dehalococcoidia bacterium]
MPFWSSKKTTEKDPVCGMGVDPKKAAASQEHMGKTYYFCSPGCKASFAKEPEKYVKGPPATTGGMSGGHH